MALQSLNHTQVSNEFLDKWMFMLNPSAVLCFLAICRKTIGWHKETDKISYSQLMKMTGLSRRGVALGIKQLEEKDLICAFRDTKRTTTYEINFNLGNSVAQNSQNLGTSVYIQKKEDKEILDPRNINLTSVAASPQQLPEKPVTQYQVSKSSNKEPLPYKFFGDLFFQEHRRELEYDPSWGPKEQGLLKKDMIRMRSMSRIDPTVKWEKIFAGMIQMFFRDKVPKVARFASEAGYTYGVFHSQIDAICAWIEVQRRKRSA